MFVWLIQTYWHTRLKPLNLWCLPLLSFEIPQQPQNRNFRDSWLCNCSVTVPIFPSGTPDCGALSKGLLLWSYSLRKCNPSKQQALGFTTTHQKSPEGFLGTLVRRLNPKYFWKKILGSKTVLSKSFLGSSWIYLVWSHYISIRLKIYILPYKDAYHIAFNFAISSYYPHFSSNL